MDSSIDVSGYDLRDTLAKERRRRQEASEGEGLSELALLLLPLSVALARLTARTDVREAMQ